MEVDESLALLFWASKDSKIGKHRHFVQGIVVFTVFRRKDKDFSQKVFEIYGVSWSLEWP